MDAVLFDAGDGAVSGRLAVVPRCEVERLPRLAPVEFALLREIAAAYPHPVGNGGTCEKTSTVILFLLKTGICNYRRRRELARAHSPSPRLAVKIQCSCRNCWHSPRKTGNF